MPRPTRPHRYFTDVSTIDSILQGPTANVPIREYLPLVPREEAVPMVWIHGGGWAEGGLDQEESDAVALEIASTGRPVRAVDYRLVPPLRVGESSVRPSLPLQPSENRFPAAIDDVKAVAREFANSSDGRIVIGGASAGANLAVAATVSLRGEPSVTVLGLALAYGAFHSFLPPVPDTVRSRLTGRVGREAFTPDTYNRLTFNYVGDERLFSQAFPMDDLLADLPPSLVMDADRDSLRASGEKFAIELRAAGREVDYVVIEKTAHGFLNQPKSQGFRRGIHEITAWLDTHDSRG